ARAGGEHRAVGWRCGRSHRRNHLRVNHMTEPRIAKDESVSLLWMFAVLVRDRRVLLASTAAGIVLGLTVMFLRAKTFTTTFSFLPQSENVVVKVLARRNITVRP